MKIACSLVMPDHAYGDRVPVVIGTLHIRYDVGSKQQERS